MLSKQIISQLLSSGLLSKFSSEIRFREREKNKEIKYLRGETVVSAQLKECHNSYHSSIMIIIKESPEQVGVGWGTRFHS